MRTPDPSLPPPRLLSAGDLLQWGDLGSLLRVCAGEDGVGRPIGHPRIQKSGLVLAGHLTGVVPTRVQVFGETEMTFLETVDGPTRTARLRAFFELLPSLVVVTRGVEPAPELLEAARATKSPLAVSTKRSSHTIAAIHAALDDLLAPTRTVHGVLVDIHGVGVLLLGPSGIGKSECALFLVERGHRLVADDQVILRQRPSGRIEGTPPPLLRHHLEVRGIGILNVRDLFGATAVRERKTVELVVELCPWRSDEPYERLGLEDLRHEILGAAVPMLRIPISPGRDMGVLLEVAARNQLLKRSGHDPARRFAAQLARGLDLAVGQEGQEEEEKP